MKRDVTGRSIVLKEPVGASTLLKRAIPGITRVKFTSVQSVTKASLPDAYSPLTL